MVNLFTLVEDRSYDELVRLVQKAREVANSESNEDLKAAVGYVIRGTVTWKPGQTPAMSSILEFLFPPMGKFYLDGYPGHDESDTPVLTARSTGERWNGWAVPAPTYAELVDYAEQVRAVVSPEDYREFMVSLLETYGGNEDMDGEATHPVCSWTWSEVTDPETV